MKKKLLVPLSLALLAMAMFGGVASAAQPNIKGCFGATTSALAGPNHGPATSYFARSVDGPWDLPGLGEEVQWVQAGNPALVPSACED
jgi:hypothetical protein